MNDELAELDPLDRLFFISLWNIADFNGNVEWRPKKIKTLTLPYDDCDLDQIAINLDKSGFVRMYSDGEKNYLNVVEFKVHQTPHINEKNKGTNIPDYSDDLREMLDFKGIKNNPDKSRQTLEPVSANSPDSCSLIPDSCKLDQSEIDRLFELFWSEGTRPANTDVGGLKRVGRTPAKVKFTIALKKLPKESNPEKFVRHIIADIHTKILNKEFGFDSLHPKTYLFNERWTDENYENSSGNNSKRSTEPSEKNAAASAALTEYIQGN